MTLLSYSDFSLFQSPSLSGISWYNLSSLDVGLVVSLRPIFPASSCLSLQIFYYPSPPGAVSLNKDKFAYQLLLNILQTSGSLYGALVGSAVAFSIADVIG